MRNMASLKRCIPIATCFKVNQGEEERLTQFGRAMKELGVGLIYARTHKPKGALKEQTGHCRTVWLRNYAFKISAPSKKQMPFFRILAKYNQKFGKKPRSSFNAHRPLKQKENLAHILCEKSTRNLSKDLEVSYEGEIYQIQGIQ